ncbi:MAG TPA: hypothetical protein VHL14_13355 [Steroidobacteraceae bacterium]|nr:hypothetical protein [Steroidobacteraceae bacterium]
MLLASLLLMTGGCVSTSTDVRSWIDDQTAVSATAQIRPLSFSRNDIQNGVSIVNYADVGAFEVNEAGRRSYYLSVLDWSIVTKVMTANSRTVDDFSTLTIHADDQSISLRRFTQDHAMLKLTADVFQKRLASVNQNYYDVSIDQLMTIAHAKKLRLTAGNQNTGDTFYLSASGEKNSSLTTFAEEVSRTASLARPASGR